MRAHTAIEKVRAGTAGLSDKQQGHLAQAERSLQEVAALAAEAGALDAGAEEKLTISVLSDRGALREAPAVE